jgi:hypothetical protein
MNLRWEVKGEGDRSQEIGEKLSESQIAADVADFADLNIV